MQIELSQDAIRLAQAAVDSGRFPNIAAAVNEAVLAMPLDDEELDEVLCAALQKAENSIARGEYHAMTPELFEQLTQQGIADAKAGKDVGLDVIP